ncbi:MAG: HIT domain-containing protein [Candidatus Nitrosopelagicus sp.]|jgi:histidine triad (HIT) family protein|nr:HIT domain-containing protein [Candidatus Nitrosopelagicus sp.]NWJ89955.1 HIT domain-containing protein [Marine Group I thaumarchaeote]|tara:strand:+ start:586 stop:996 length:411 start_codon:yes stop_codon:yes gene_type:complete
MDCIFCKIAKKEIPAKIVTETEKSIAFLDTFPLSRGHTLIIPKHHYEKVQDVTVDDNTDLFETLHKVISKVDKITGSTLLAIHNGKGSGQEIPHVHVHLIPRQPDDLAGPVHSMFKNRPKLSDDELDKLCTEIKES